MCNHPQDPGTTMEFKTPTRPTPGAVSGLLQEAAHKIHPHGNGHVVLDGRPTGLTEEAARSGYTHYVRQRTEKGKPLAQVVTIILGSGNAITWRADAQV